MTNPFNPTALAVIAPSTWGLLIAVGVIAGVLYFFAGQMHRVLVFILLAVAVVLFILWLIAVVGVSGSTGLP